MRFFALLFGLFFCAGIVLAHPFSGETPTSNQDFSSFSAATLPGGGGDKDKKKNKKDDEKKGQKMSKLMTPAKRAKASAKQARFSAKQKDKMIQDRAKVRLFFHRIFDPPVGRPVNFRKSSHRRRWKKNR